MELESTLHLQQQIARLQALLEASHKIHSTIELDSVLRAVLELSVRELEMAGAFFTAFPFSYGEIQPRFLLHPPTSDPKRGCFRFPLLDRSGSLLTEMIVLTRDCAPLSLYEQDFLENLSMQAAVAIENARYHERTLDLERVQQDLASAREIQRSLLPQAMPVIPGYSISARSQTCYEVGGDYLDILPLPDSRWMIVVADVAGKGLASALVGTSFRSAFRAMAASGLPLEEMAAKLNHVQEADGAETRRRYVTAIFAQLNPAENTLDVVNAGHNPGFLVHGKDIQEIGASGTPVGMLAGMTYTSTRYHLEQNSRFLMYTDGLTEVFRGDEEFGPERLVEEVRSWRGTQAEQLLNSVWSAVESFDGEVELTDDRTALALLRVQ